MNVFDEIRKAIDEAPISYSAWIDDDQIDDIIEQMKDAVNKVEENFGNPTLCYLCGPCEYQNEDIRIEDNNGWIPVSSGMLPEDGVNVQVTYIGCRRGQLLCDAFAYMENGEWHWSLDNSKVAVKIIAYRRNCIPYAPEGE